MKILLRSIPHQHQRYDTCGDWRPASTDGEVDEITVSDLHHDDYNFLVALHELIEFWLCRRAGIAEETVTRWDLRFHGPDPGDDPKAPYHREHTLATAVERIVAEALDIDWGRYNRAFDRLPEWKKKK